MEKCQCTCGCENQAIVKVLVPSETLRNLDVLNPEFIEEELCHSCLMNLSEALFERIEVRKALAPIMDVLQHRKPHMN